MKSRPYDIFRVLLLLINVSVRTRPLVFLLGGDHLFAHIDLI